MTLSDREVLVASPVPVTLSVNVTPSLYSPESDGFPSLACSCRPWLYTAMFLTCFGFDNLCYRLQHLWDPVEREDLVNFIGVFFFTLFSATPTQLTSCLCITGGGFL